jgi:L-ribulose-5-phosphate 4-epimerase
VHDELRDRVAAANRDLAVRGLTQASFGNVSEADREAGVLAIKPSGIPCAEVRAEDVALVTLAGGEHLDGLKPSSDTPTHLELYGAFADIGGVVHTHSTFVPCTRELTEVECEGEYERLTGVVIVEALEGRDPLDVPAALVASHGAFTWGSSADDAVEQAAALEEIARLAFNTVLLNATRAPVSDALLGRHFRRKHGPTAYYGQ